MSVPPPASSLEEVRTALSEHDHHSLVVFITTGGKAKLWCSHCNDYILAVVPQAGKLTPQGWKPTPDIGSL